MTLINDPASFPSFMWAVTRLLLTLDGKSDGETAKRLLTPPSLPAGAETKDFSQAIDSLADLGLVTSAASTVELTGEVRDLSPVDLAGFNRVLRRAALAPERNMGLADKTENPDKPDLKGPKDLVRALAWFLTQNPGTPLDWDAVGKLQPGALASHLPRPFATDVRWNRFVYWAPALGFAAQPLFPQDGPVRLVPDCSVAVRETILGLWKEGQQVNATEAVDRIIEELPVLPGGVYSRSLGLVAPGGEVSPSLSNALLTGAEDGWITLVRRSDANDMIFLTDASSTRVRVTDFKIEGSF